jgi:hypothetical protein
MTSVKRNGTRINCEIPVGLRVDSFRTKAEQCVVILVNPQGCAARFHRPLEIGAAVQFEGLPTGCATARVVNCVSVMEGGKFWLLGLALDEPGNVWGIATPPEDWRLDLSAPPFAMSFSARAGRS